MRFSAPGWITATVCCTVSTTTVTVTKALTCVVPPTRRPRARHRVSPYLGSRRQNETKMFSDQDETSPSIAAVSAEEAADSSWCS